MVGFLLAICLVCLATACQTTRDPKEEVTTITTTTTASKNETAPAAGVVITNVTWEGSNQPKPGVSVVFTVTLKNNGTEDVPAETPTTVTLLLDRTELTPLVLNETLAVGESKTLRSKPWTAVAGDHVVTASLNGGHTSCETFGSGVTFVKNIHVATKALPIPEPAAAANMKVLAFSDDFSNLDTIDLTASGKSGYKWYMTSPYGYETMLPEDLEKTEDGVKIVIRTGSNVRYGLRMVDVKTGAGWGYTHGYMETRFRMAATRLDENAKEAPPSIWANPPHMLWGNSEGEWVEFDFMEYFGYTQGSPLFTVTLHHQDRPKGAGNDNVVYWAKNRKTSHFNGLDDDEWHTMGWLWEEGRLTTYLDGKELMTQRWSKDGLPEPEAKLEKGDALRPGTFSLLDEQIIPVVLHGVESWPLEIDYLNIWQAD